MTWMIGIDEAGYGPNLGPLCVGASAWKVGEKAEGGRGKGEKVPSIDLYERLADVVSPTPDRARIAIADSKQLYKPAGHSGKNRGLSRLEQGVLTALSVLGKLPTDWRSLFGTPSLPWYADFNCRLPIDCLPAEITELADRFTAHCRNVQVRLLELRTRTVFPGEFNELTEQHGTKGAALSHISIGLLKSVLTTLPTASCPPDIVSITCDKHGGRNRYAALLQHHFPDDWIETLEESRPLSRYRWGPPEARVQVCFRTKGEAELPVALASMAAKYHRELAMRAFNAFWATQVPGLKPTAGYPQDAKRFKQEIATVQSKLGIDDSVLWRNR